MIYIISLIFEVIFLKKLNFFNYFKKITYALYYIYLIYRCTSVYMRPKQNIKTTKIIKTIIAYR